MIENKPIYDIYNKPKQLFNISDFTEDYRSITANDLVNYAQKQRTNIFTQMNEFKVIKFYDEINGINSDTFDYISDLTDYAQKQINTINNTLTSNNNSITLLNTKTTDIIYDSNITSINNLTKLINTLIQDNLSIGLNLSIGSNLNVNKITCFDIYNSSVNTNLINTNNLIINNNTFYDTICFLYTNNITIPIIKSLNLLSLNIDCLTINKITIKPNILFQILDINDNIQYSIYNNTDNYLYNQNIIFSIDSFKINIYINNILII